MKSVYDILLTPVLTEKSYSQFNDRKYTFKVDINANKFQIKDAVEKVFDVKVEKVYTMRYDGKLRNQRRGSVGRTPRYKKAIVKLTADSKSIEFFNAVGLDYVSCSPYRVPVARLAAAQAAVKQKGQKKAVENASHNSACCCKAC